MRTRQTRHSLLALALLGAAVAACSGGGGDDDDDGGTPDPGSPTSCQIVWVTRDPPAQTDFFDYYVVDAPVASWETGDHSYFLGDTTGATNVTGAWVDDYDLVAREWTQAALATSGVFTLALGSGASPHAPGVAVDFDDATPQEYYLLGSSDELTTAIGEAGTGSFLGEWSAPGSPDVVEGSGTISIAHLGSDLTLGLDVAFAQCYGDASAFAPLSRIERVRLAGERAGELLRR
jgi:hypothetical protein